MASHYRNNRKETYKLQNLSKKVLVDKKSITETKSIAENFIHSLVQPWQKILVHQLKAEMYYIKKYGTTQPEKVISVNEFWDAFFSLKINKRAGYDDISYNVNLLEIYKNLCCTYLIFLCKPVFFQITQDR